MEYEDGVFAITTITCGIRGGWCGSGNPVCKNIVDGIPKCSTCIEREGVYHGVINDWLNRQAPTREEILKNVENVTAEHDVIEHWRHVKKMDGIEKSHKGNCRIEGYEHITIECAVCWKCGSTMNPENITEMLGGIPAAFCERCNCVRAAEMIYRC